MRSSRAESKPSSAGSLSTRIARILETSRRMRQLTSLDAQFLALESARQAGHVGGVAILDPSTAPGGTVDAQAIKELLAERLPHLPPFRWRLTEVPLGLDYPYWLE